MNILSLFDGIACGLLALKKSGIDVDNYYACEIDNACNRFHQIYNPDVQLISKDVTTLQWDDNKPKIDLLIFGSPCTGFSSAGKQLNFDDPRSALFFDAVRIMKECNPTYFLLENVGMKKEWMDVITSHMGVEPIMINSALVSGQHRVRNYWTNIPNVTVPEDRGIILQSILDSGTKEHYPAGIRGRRLDENGVNKGKPFPLNQCLEVKTPTDKSNCLSTVSKDNVITSLTPGRYPNAYEHRNWREYSIAELCRLQTIDPVYLDGKVSNSAATKMLGNGWTVDVISHIFDHIPK